MGHVSCLCSRRGRSLLRLLDWVDFPMLNDVFSDGLQVVFPTSSGLPDLDYSPDLGRNRPLRRMANSAVESENAMLQTLRHYRELHVFRIGADA